MAKAEGREGGIVNEVEDIIKKFNVKEEIDQGLKEIKQKASDLIVAFKDDEEAQFYIIRKLLFDLSNLVRTIQKANAVDWQGMSDILYFYSITFTYFTNHSYPAVSSEKEATVRKCDIPDFSKYFEKSKQF